MSEPMEQDIRRFFRRDLESIGKAHLLGNGPAGLVKVGGEFVRVVPVFSGLQFEVNPAWLRDEVMLTDPPRWGEHPYFSYAMPVVRQQGGVSRAWAYAIASEEDVQTWMLEYKARGGRAEQRADKWLAGRIVARLGDSHGFFRWVGEPRDVAALPDSRRVRLNNIADFVPQYESSLDD